MASDRMDQVNELIKREIAVILQRSFGDYLPTVTQAEVSKDLSYAKIWITGIGNTDELQKKCKIHAKEIRQELAGKIILRKIPYLQFVIDSTEAEADKIEKIFDQLKKEDK